MKSKYRNLSDHEAGEALILDDYLRYAIMFPDKVREHTTAIRRSDCKDCVVIMALVNALIRNQEQV